MSADFWAGYLSGAAGIIIGNPLDLIKTRLQAGTLSSTSTSDSFVADRQTQVPRSSIQRAGQLVKG
jgi:solute carrier family 25 carnitine/acylcarnitine transporter 20/29